MSTYEDVVRADQASLSWALAEASGTDFAPWLGTPHLTGAGTLLYRQAGPFTGAYGLHLAAAASLRTPVLSSNLTGALVYECWFKVDVNPPTAAHYIYFVGTAASNGYGAFVNLTDSHVKLQQGSSGSGTVIDTGYVWPDTGWHLFTQGGDGLAAYLAIDGQVVWRGLPLGTGTPIVPPSPNQVSWGSDAAGGAIRACSFSYPTVYLRGFSASIAYASYLAATDPTNALPYTPGGTSDALAAILAAVRRTYS